mgnify:CR=1 FL=1
MLDRVKAAQAIEANIPAICRNGSLTLRKEQGRQPSFCIRFRTTSPDTGALKQRSINLGQDEELIAGIREAISIRTRMREEKRLAKAKRAECRQRYRPLEAALRGKIKGSRRYRESIKKALWTYCANEPNPNLDVFLAGLDDLGLRRRRRGRPYARRLW